MGEEILIEAKVLKQGRTLAFLEVELRNKLTNELLIKASHTAKLKTNGTFACL